MSPTAPAEGLQLTPDDACYEVRRACPYSPACPTFAICRARRGLPAPTERPRRGRTPKHDFDARDALMAVVS